MLFGTLLRQEFKTSKDRFHLFHIALNISMKAHNAKDLFAFPWSTACVCGDAAQNIICLLCCQSTLPAHVSQPLKSCRDAPQRASLLPVLMQFICFQVQDSAFFLSEFQKVPVGSFLHLSLFLDSSSALGLLSLVSFANSVTTHSMPPGKAKMLNKSGQGRPMHSSSAYRQLSPLPWTWLINTFFTHFMNIFLVQSFIMNVMARTTLVSVWVLSPFCLL